MFPHPLFLEQNCLLPPLAPRAFHWHLATAPPPFPACPRAGAPPSPQYVFILSKYVVLYEGIEQISTIQIAMLQKSGVQSSGEGDVAGRFPVVGATCCRERTPPPGAVGSPCVHYRYSSQRNWPPGFITAVHGSCAGAFGVLSTFLICLCRWGKPSEKWICRQHRKALSAPALQGGPFWSGTEGGFWGFWTFASKYLRKVCLPTFALSWQASNPTQYFLVGFACTWFSFLRERGIYTSVKLQSDARLFFKDC